MTDEDSFPTLDGEPIPSRTSNGHSLTAVKHESELLARREAHRRETGEEASRRDGELNELRDLRREARIELAARLGDFGLIYEPEENSLQRLLIGDAPAPDAAGIRDVPAPFDPKEFGLTEEEPKEFSPTLLKWIDGISWFAVLLIGPFIGYSIGLLAGLPVKAQPLFAAASVLFGIGVLAAMKGSLYAIIHHTVRRARTEGVVAPATVAFVAAGLLVLAEAGLGTVAVVRYSEDRSVTAADVIPFWQAALIALCFSTPILLASIFKGWADGRDHQDLSDAARLEAQRYHEERAAAQREHDAAERARADEAIRRHAEAIARFETTNDEYRDDPRWRTAMSLFGTIATYDVEITERERLLTNFKIGRGHEHASVKKES